MTFARLVYKLMKPEVPYTVEELTDMVIRVMNEYHRRVVDGEVTIEEALDCEWFAVAERGDIPGSIRKALKVTRDFGYTKVNVAVTPAHDEVGTCHYTKGGVHRSFKKTYHYGEHKEFTYIRIK